MSDAARLPVKSMQTSLETPLHPKDAVNDVKNLHDSHLPSQLEPKYLFSH